MSGVPAQSDAEAATPAYADMAGLAKDLYASLLDEEPWTAFLERLRVVARADFVTLILTARQGERPDMLLTPGGDPEVAQAYIRDAFAYDPFTGLPEGRVMHFRDFVGGALPVRSAAYEAFLRQTSSEIIGVDICEGEALQLRLRYTRRSGAQPFGAADMARMETLVPHLRVALRLFDRLATGETEQRVYAGAVEQMAVGVIMLDKGGRVMRLNPPASAILAQADGVALKGSTLALDDAAASRQLRGALARDADAPPLTLRVARPSGAGDLCLVVGPVKGRDHAGGGAGPATVLFLSDPQRAPHIPAQAVRDLLGLTQGEAAIAADIASGLSLADSAGRLGISLNTARAHLRAIFTKTGVKRQSQLMHLVHYSLPNLARPAL